MITPMFHMAILKRTIDDLVEEVMGQKQLKVALVLKLPGRFL